MTYNYYAQKLNSTNLFQVYDTKIPRINQYLNAEIAYVRRCIKPGDTVLEMGCGYGRVIKELANYAKTIVGIDISEESIQFGKRYLEGISNVRLLIMDAHNVELSESFDIVLCLQNGLSAMKGEPLNLIQQALNHLKAGGKTLFSTYSDLFWKYRLSWFEEQAQKKLLGEIDYERTKDGVIHCKDGFTARTFTAEELTRLGETTGQKFEITTVDDSSVFLKIIKNKES